MKLNCREGIRTKLNDFLKSKDTQQILNNKAAVVLLKLLRQMNLPTCEYSVEMFKHFLTNK